MNKRKCKNCSTFWKPNPTTPRFVKWCSPECQEALALKALQKIRAAQTAKIKQDRKQDKIKHARKKKAFYETNIPTRRKAAVAEFHKYIHWRDRGLACISCGKPAGSGKFDAGHYINSGSCAALRFDPYNVNLQCSNNCNIHNSGNGIRYRKGLLKKYGQEIVDYLEGPQPLIKLTAELYKQIEDKYKKLNESRENLCMESSEHV